ncbi:MAG TPA: hypothetical protein VD767_04605 [Thermomicrobiales bacterium]|nr:hypothetical protein [Thermomicrobiales bacterium]
MDIRHCLALSTEEEGPRPFFHQMFRRWTTPLVWLEVLTLLDVSFHIGDADHVRNLLVSNREVD